MTTLTERHGQQSAELEKLKDRIRRLKIGVVVLVIALSGLGGWTVYDQGSSSDTAVTPEIQAVLDDYLDAWNEYDISAFLGIVTGNYSMGWPGPTPLFSGANDVIRDWISREADGIRFDLAGEPIMSSISERGPWSVAAVLHEKGTDWETQNTVIFLVVEEEGTLKVGGHWIGWPITVETVP